MRIPGTEVEYATAGADRAGALRSCRAAQQLRERTGYHGPVIIEVDRAGIVHAQPAPARRGGRTTADHRPALDGR